jgi:hypothetical protein
MKGSITNMKRKPFAAFLAALLATIALFAAIPVNAAPTPEEAMKDAYIYSVGDSWRIMQRLSA